MTHPALQRTRHVLASFRYRNPLVLVLAFPLSVVGIPVCQYITYVHIENIACFITKTFYLYIISSYYLHIYIESIVNPIIIIIIIISSSSSIIIQTHRYADSDCFRGTSQPTGSQRLHFIHTFVTQQIDGIGTHRRPMFFNRIWRNEENKEVVTLGWRETFSDSNMPEINVGMNNESPIPCLSEALWKRCHVAMLISVIGCVSFAIRIWSTSLSCPFCKVEMVFVFP